MATRKKRTYVKASRAESEAETRHRIVEAVAALHEEVGPRQTTIKSVAERAGVQRLTVYRHFPGMPALIMACAARWNERMPPPAIPSSRLDAQGARTLLLELYDYYRRGERILAKIVADAPYMPELAAELAPFDEYLAELASAIARSWRGRTSARRLTTLRHAVQFSTWQSLSTLAGTDEATVDLVFRWCEAV
jgi:AcrR family transcriptional regulator